MSNPKLATEKQVQEVSDTFIEIINHQGKQIKALESGVIDAIEPSSPAPTKRGEYKVTKPGVFLNFKDANGQPISVTQEDYSSGTVSIIFNGVDCRVLIIPITFEGEVKEGDTRGVSGNEVFSSLPEYIESVNLFNENNVQNNKYVTTNSAIIQTGSGWSCSEFIPVDPVDYYLSGNKNRSGVGFYNKDKEAIRYTGVNIGLITPRNNEKFVVFNLKSDVSGDYSNIQFEKGSSPTSYVGFGKTKIIKETSVNSLPELLLTANESALITSNIKLEDESSGRNLINPNYFEKFALLVNSGTTVNNTEVALMYNTTDYIEIEPNQVYTGLRIDSSNVFRYTCFYTKDKEYIDRATITEGHTDFISPLNAAYVRISIANEHHPNVGVGDMTNVGLFEGNTPTWSYYGVRLRLLNSVPTGGKEDNDIASISDIKSLLEDTDENGNDFTFINGIITCKYDIGVISGELDNKRAYTGNDMYNFLPTKMKNISIGGPDDVAPMHILNLTMGANHGYTHYHATILKHNLNNLDIGSEFKKDGTNFYLLRIVDENTVAFLSENKGTEASPLFVKLTKGVVLRKGEQYIITEVISAQLYPSIGELEQNLILNGARKVTENQKGKYEKLEVIENYVIYDPSTVLNNIIARTGQTQEPVFIGEPNVRVENIYRFLTEPACLIFVNVQFLKEIEFKDIMAAQAVVIGGNYGKTKYYIPNSNPLNDVIDFRKPNSIQWSNDIPPTFVINSTQPDPDNPPNRVVQYNGDLGFMICYVLTRGQGKNIASFTDRTFEIRNNTGKVYPHPIEGTKVGTTTTNDSIYSVAMARVYTDLTKTRLGNRLSIFSFTVDNELHVYIDYSGSMIDKINLKNLSLNGKKIEVLESKNTILKNNIYNNGFVINAEYIEDDTCYIVLIIKS